MIINQHEVSSNTKNAIKNPDYIIKDEHFDDVVNHYIKTFERTYYKVTVRFEDDKGEITQISLLPLSELQNYLDYANYHGLIKYQEGEDK